MISVEPELVLRPARDDLGGVESPVKVKVARWRSVYTVRTGQGDYVVKPLRVGAGKAWLTGKLLSSNVGCPVLPVLVAGGSNGAYWWYGGNRYLITEKISGREADYWQINDLSAAIRAMAQFHCYTAKIVAERQLGWNLLQFDPELTWRQAYSEMETCRRLAIRRRDPWSKQYLKLWYHFSNQAAQALREITALPEAGSKVICYHDWAHHNVLLGDERVYLIDFDSMVVDAPAHDRANLADRYLRLHGWTERALLQLLWQFDRFYRWRRGELTRWRIYLTFPYDYWMIGRQYYLERQPWSAKYYQEQWRRKIASYQAREKVLEMLDGITEG